MIELTREQAIKLYRTSIGKAYLMSMPLEDRLKGHSAEEVLKRYSVEQRCKGIPEDEIRAYLARNSNSEESRD